VTARRPGVWMVGEDSSSRPITELLLRWRQGDGEALGELVPLVYDELCRLARREMRAERRDHTLQPTALVHEAYARLVDLRLPWQDRAHFFSMAVRQMRRVLVDHARERAAAKRGGGAVKLTLSEAGGEAAVPPCDVTELDAALCRLERPAQGRLERVGRGSGCRLEATAPEEISDAAQVAVVTWPSQLGISVFPWLVALATEPLAWLGRLSVLKD